MSSALVFSILSFAARALLTCIKDIGKTIMLTQSNYSTTGTEEKGCCRKVVRLGRGVI